MIAAQTGAKNSTESSRGKGVWRLSPQTLQSVRDITISIVVCRFKNRRRIKAQIYEVKFIPSPESD